MLFWFQNDVHRLTEEERRDMMILPFHSSWNGKQSYSLCSCLVRPHCKMGPFPCGVFLRERGMSGSGKVRLSCFLSAGQNPRKRRSSAAKTPSCRKWVSDISFLSALAGKAAMYCVIMTYGLPPISKRGLSMFAGVGASLAGIRGMTVRVSKADGQSQTGY